MACSMAPFGWRRLLMRSARLNQIRPRRPQQRPPPKTRSSRALTPCRTTQTRWRRSRPRRHRPNLILPRQRLLRRPRARPARLAVIPRTLQTRCSPSCPSTTPCASTRPSQRIVSGYAAALSMSLGTKPTSRRSRSICKRCALRD